VSIQATLEHYGVRSIWHFTDMSNIQSIENNGLLSLRNLINNNNQQEEIFVEFFQ